MRIDDKLIFLTGDLGFQAFENIQAEFPERFINVGVAEQNMINISAGLASEGLKPVCYSIAPFLVFRPFEQIRINLALHNQKVMLVGNGGGFGYGIMGATHHALEDIAVLSTLQNFTCVVPHSNEHLDCAADYCFSENCGPSYLRMGFGTSEKMTIETTFEKVSHLTFGNDITVVGIGPVMLNMLEKIDNYSIDLFAVNQMPLTEISLELINSLKKTKKLLVLEEHVLQGGLGQSLVYEFHKLNLPFLFRHLYVQGYPNNDYGNQDFHQKQNSLDTNSILNTIESLINDTAKQ